IASSGLYKLVYEAEFLHSGGTPYGAIIANYDFGPEPEEMALLMRCASVSTMAHAPFIAAASPRFFRLARHSDLAGVTEIQRVLRRPDLAAYESFRETEDARYVGLTVPRFLLREVYRPEPHYPHTVQNRAFAYREGPEKGREAFLWGNAS